MWLLNAYSFYITIHCIHTIISIYSKQSQNVCSDLIHGSSSIPKWHSKELRSFFPLLFLCFRGLHYSPTTILYNNCSLEKLDPWDSHYHLQGDSPPLLTHTSTHMMPTPRWSGVCKTCCTQELMTFVLINIPYWMLMKPSSSSNPYVTGELEWWWRWRNQLEMWRGVGGSVLQ